MLRTVARLAAAGAALVALPAAAQERGAPGAPADTTVRAESLLVLPGMAAITGQVRDERGATVVDAEVRVVGDALSTRTDGAGWFVLPVRPRDGTVPIEVRRIGFSPARFDAVVAAGGVWEGRIQLRALAQALPEVRVVATWGKPSRLAITRKFDDFYRRRQLAKGVFVTREELEDSRARGHVLEFLQAKPGVRVMRVGFGYRVLFPRCDLVGRIALVVDGIRVRTDPWAYLDTISPQDVEAMEVYGGLARVPAELAGEQVCGALGVWLRDR